MYTLALFLLLVVIPRPATCDAPPGGAPFDQTGRGSVESALISDAHPLPDIAESLTARKPSATSSALSTARGGDRTERRVARAEARKAPRAAEVKSFAKSSEPLRGSVRIARATTPKNTAVRGASSPKGGREGASDDSMFGGYPSGAKLRKVKARVNRGEEHFDPTRSGIPTVDTSGDVRFIKLSDNFSVREFARSGRAVFGVARIDPRLVMCLQSLRDRVGQPVYVYSGYRSFFHNNEVYRKKHRKPTDSQHIAGKAGDIKIDGMTGLEVTKAAIDACGPDIGLGIGGGYAHIDVRGSFASWRYEDSSDRQLADLRQYRENYIIVRRTRARRSRGRHAAD